MAFAITTQLASAASSLTSLNLNLPNIQFDPQTMDRIDYTWTLDQYAGGLWDSFGIIEETTQEALIHIPFPTRMGRRLL